MRGHRPDPDPPDLTCDCSRPFTSGLFNGRIECPHCGLTEERSLFISIFEGGKRLTCSNCEGEYIVRIAVHPAPSDEEIAAQERRWLEAVIGAKAEAEARLHQREQEREAWRTEPVAYGGGQWQKVVPSPSKEGT